MALRQERGRAGELRHMPGGRVEAEQGTSSRQPGIGAEAEKETVRRVTRSQGPSKSKR